MYTHTQKFYFHVKHATLNTQKAMATSPQASHFIFAEQKDGFSLPESLLGILTDSFSVPYNVPKSPTNPQRGFFLQSISDYKEAGGESQISEK